MKGRAIENFVYEMRSFVKGIFQKGVWQIGLRMMPVSDFQGRLDLVDLRRCGAIERLIF